MRAVVERRSLGGLTVALAAGVAVCAATAPYADAVHATGPCRPHPHRPVFGLNVEALADPGKAQLDVGLAPLVGGCRSPAFFDTVRVSTISASRRLVWRFHHVRAHGGHATLVLDGLTRGARLRVLVLLPRSRLTFGKSAVVRLRPDLALVRAALRDNLVAGVPAVVAVRLREQNGDTGTQAKISVSDGGVVVGSTGPVAVRAGGGRTLGVRVTVSSGGAHALSIALSDRTERETDTANNTAELAATASDFVLAPTQVLVHGFAGYGIQFNQHEYADISVQAGVTNANVTEMEQKVIALQPQFVRLFFDPSEFLLPDRMASFVRTAELAQRAGATIDVTWEGGGESQPFTTMERFADVLAGLVRNDGVTAVRWATVENEPNTTRLSTWTYMELYRELDRALRDRGLRTQIRLLAGDLVGTRSPTGQTQKDWFRFMATHMTNWVDAYSIHVYWDYWNPAKLVRRLTEVRQIVNALPPGGRRPLYVAEYGIRGLRSKDGTTYPEPGIYADGTPLEETTINAFQHAWFDLLAPRLGYYGLSKWDGFFGKYDTGTQDFSLIGPPQEGWPLRPVYYLTRLFTQTVKPGWNVVGLTGAPAQKLVTAYASPSGDLTLIGLDTAGASLDTVSSTVVPYTLDGLPPNTTFRLSYWNLDGTGGNASAGSVRSDALGQLNVTAPLQSVFALTTLG
jgi:hypothetical protein